MADLYKGIAGSPITYLASDISAAQTTISIADDTALPDAPNICTIGFGENIETIRYGTKSNGVLQEVTRGIEGTPRAWQAGTEVARFFTAHDHNAIIAELEDARLSDVKEKTFDDLKGRLEEIEQDHDIHLAESASKHIHSSGENWKRFDDGSAEVWGQYVCTGNIGGGGYALLGATESLPISFVDTPIATITLSNESNYANYTAGIRITPYLWSLTPTKITIRAYDPWNENLAEDDVVLINYIIKGRWK